LVFSNGSIALACASHTLFQSVNLNALEAVRVGCCLLGLWWLAQVGHSLVVYVFRMFVVTGSFSFYGALDTYQKIDLFVLIIDVIFALILMFRSGAIANRLMRLPFASTDEQK
jgi:hypothetical protein